MATKPKMRGRIRIDYAKLNGLTDAKVRHGLESATAEGRRLMDAELRQPGKGKMRPNGKTRASRPGDPPAPDTGALRRSLANEVYRKGDGYTGVVSANKQYAAPLEFGTEKMKPRPFMALLLGKHKAALLAAFFRGARRG